MATHSLEHRSSLRKLPFPASCLEALRRLYTQCVTFAHKQPSPKEIEVVLEVIDEFIFFSSNVGVNAKNSKQQQQSTSGISLSTNPAIQELQMLQVLLDFFSDDNSSGNSEQSVLCMVFLFLFMESKKSSANSSSGRNSRIVVMSKLISMAMGLKSKNLLFCAALWLHQQQGPATDKFLELSRLLVDDYILLLPPPPPPASRCSSPSAFESLRDLPEVSQLFCANFLAAISELYYQDDSSQPPPKLLVELIVAWISANPMLPFTAVHTSTQAVLPPGSANSSPQTPLLGLAKWTILSALFAHQPGDLFSTLHLNLLESFAEAQNRRKELRNDIIPVKRVSLLIQRLESAMAAGSCNATDKEKCLDRLGQFLQAATAAECLSGKTVEIISALKMLPANRLIQMYVVNLAKV